VQQQQQQQQQRLVMLSWFSKEYEDHQAGSAAKLLYTPGLC
jgi:hypothetical protein